MMARFVRNAFATVTSLAALAAAGACTGNDLAPSTFPASDADTSCTGAVDSLPANPPPGTLVRAITFHVTNDSGQPRWVQTGADDGCSTFDLVRGGAPFTLVPPAACGCECKAPEPRTSYTRLAPGESVDLPWNGLVYQLRQTCVTGAAFGCAEGETREILTATASPAPVTRYDGVLHVESIEPPGCSAQSGSALFACGAEGAVPGQCAHGTGAAHFELVLPAPDVAPQSIPVSLK
jgi:hypothetical protein